MLVLDVPVPTVMKNKHKFINYNYSDHGILLYKHENIKIKNRWHRTYIILLVCKISHFYLMARIMVLTVHTDHIPDAKIWHSN